MSRKQTGQDKSQGASGFSCPSLTGGFRGFFGSLFSYCPYTMLAKKILRFLRGETGTPANQITNREIHLKSNIRIGYGIMLVGIFCPLFWLSLLAGARGDQLMFNAIHSFLVFLFGLGFVIVYRIQLGREFGGTDR